jgi:hypothetical protein
VTDLRDAELLLQNGFYAGRIGWGLAALREQIDIPISRREIGMLFLPQRLPRRPRHLTNPYGFWTDKE